MVSGILFFLRKVTFINNLCLFFSLLTFNPVNFISSMNWKFDNNDYTYYGMVALTVGARTV